jgi:hypothetical protein
VVKKKMAAGKSGAADDRPEHVIYTILHFQTASISSGIFTGQA